MGTIADEGSPEAAGQPAQPRDSDHEHEHDHEDFNDSADEAAVHAHIDVQNSGGLGEADSELFPHHPEPASPASKLLIVDGGGEEDHDDPLSPGGHHLPLLSPPSLPRQASK